MSEIENMLISELKAIRVEREETNRRYEDLTKQLQDLSENLNLFTKLLLELGSRSQQR